MRSFLRIISSVSALAILGGGLASAQLANDFNLLATSNGIAATIPNNGPAIDITAQVGSANSITITATYTGSTSATITTLPQVLGSTEFTATYVTVAPPFVLTPGQSFSFVVTYTPVNSIAASAQVQVAYTEPGTTANPVVNGAITLLFEGVAPNFTLDYFIQPNNNAIAISSGGTITFPATQLNTTATGGLQISNVGSGPGSIIGIALVSGSPVFQLTGTPLATPSVPYTLTPGTTTQTLTLGISYTPKAVETDTGQIVITYQNGATATINLSGSGVTSTFSYSYLSGTSTTAVPVQPLGTIVFPSVPLATSGTTQASSTVIVQVTNTGSASGTINSVNISGPGFQLVNPPATAPVLAAGGTTSFTLSYTPTQVGTQTGELVIGSAVFTVTGQGLGPQLTFAYSSAGTTVPVGTGGAVAFPSIPVSQSEQVTVTVTNSGTSNATIALITTSAPFSVPALGPITLAANQSTSVPVTFTPTAVGPVNGTLLINNTTVPLVAAGTAPPSLPSYTISGPSGTVAPATPATISLTLANTYPVDLTGVLTLTTSSPIGSDPAVQFSTGGRTIDFTIPANTTSANFVGVGPQIYLQTGTVAENITLTPSFATATGGLNLTPSSPTTLQFNVAAAAPVVEYVQVTNQTTSGFSLVVVGYTTTRSLNTLTVTLNPVSGYTFPTSQFSFDLSQAANLWFQGSTSQSFGGQFQVAVPFNLSGTVPTGQTLIQSIASVSVTISNSVGTSSSAQSNMQ